MVTGRNLGEIEGWLACTYGIIQRARAAGELVLGGGVVACVERGGEVCGGIAGGVSC